MHSFLFKQMIDFGQDTNQTYSHAKPNAIVIKNHNEVTEKSNRLKTSQRKMQEKRDNYYS